MGSTRTKEVGQLFMRVPANQASRPTMGRGASKPRGPRSSSSRSSRRPARSPSGGKKKYLPKNPSVRAPSYREPSIHMKGASQYMRDWDADSRSSDFSSRSLWPSQTSVQGHRAPETMTIPVSNNVPIQPPETTFQGVNYSAEGLICILPIHPGNPRLFPNLTGMWRNFQQYRIKRSGFRTQPLSSTLQSGAYAISTVATGQGQLGFLPLTFSSLLNLASTSVATLWRPMVYALATNIMDRLKSYLIDSPDATSSPGSVVVSSSAFSTAISSNADAPQLPLFEFSCNVHFMDFQPVSQIPASSLRLLAIASPGIAGSYALCYFPVISLKPFTVTYQYPNSGINFILSGASTSLEIIMSSPTQPLAILGTAPGTSDQLIRTLPTHSYTSGTFTEIIYRVSMAGSITIGTYGVKSNVSPGTTADLTKYAGSVMTIYARSDTDSFAATYSRLAHHLQTRSAVHSLAPQSNYNFEGVSSPTYDADSMVPLETENSASQDQDSSIVLSRKLASMRLERPSGPIKAFSPPAEGYCWLHALCALIPDLEVYSSGPSLRLILGDLELNVPNATSIPGHLLASVATSFKVLGPMSSRYRLLRDGSHLHMVARPKPILQAADIFADQLNSASSVGHFSFLRNWSSFRLLCFASQPALEDDDKPPDP